MKKIIETVFSDHFEELFPHAEYLNREQRLCMIAERIPFTIVGIKEEKTRYTDGRYVVVIVIGMEQQKMGVLYFAKHALREEILQKALQDIPTGMLMLKKGRYRFVGVEPFTEEITVERCPCCGKPLSE